LLCGDDDFDQPSVHVVDQAGYGDAGWHRLPGEVDIDAHRGVRVPDRLARKICFGDLEVGGELLWGVRELPDSAVGVLQDHRVRAGWRSSSDESAQ